MERILVIDDDFDICHLLKKFLQKNGYETEYALNGQEGVQLLKKESFNLILCDYKLPDSNGIEILQKIKILCPSAAVIIITGYSDVKTAVETLRHGAFDYVTKPLYPDEILVTIQNAIKSKSQAKEYPSTKPSLAPSNGHGASDTKKHRSFIFGKSVQAELVQKHIDLIAPTDMSVIITGETGTGKEFVANAIHQKSKRASGPFVAIDCGAIPKDLAGSELFGHVKGAFTGALVDKKGSFEMADGGTLFLDEIGNLSYDNQVKLLRVLQERQIKRVGGNKDIPIDVRVLVATNENLKDATREGRFREDIYHRLNEFCIELPPLRERREDIEIFADHFLELANSTLNKNVLGFDEQARQHLKEYYWHGNLRELQNVIKRAVLLCQKDYISPTCLPEEIVNPEVNSFADQKNMMVSAADDLKSASENAERIAIMNTLKKVGYNKTKAAHALNIDRKTLYNKLKAYDINYK